MELRFDRRYIFQDDFIPTKGRCNFLASNIHMLWFVMKRITSMKPVLSVLEIISGTITTL
ncbi:hypothetical protein [Candidatus Hodgkinia cicadicola]|uniref:hypothetical protein n=1 Tax=Candidatus Hodgkinia cicadicola TaxID=573658 RepID=UPI0011BABAEA